VFTFFLLLFAVLSFAVFPAEVPRLEVPPDAVLLFAFVLEVVRFLVVFELEANVMSPLLIRSGSGRRLLPHRLQNNNMQNT
jgi:hypothetical protein